MSLVLSVSSSRADVGILSPVWHALAAEPGLDLHIFLTGAHGSDSALADGSLPAAVVVHRGGESSEGAVDERIRHAISKLAHIHCVASVDAAMRLNKMGEEPWRIHVTGAPGLDSLLAAPQLSADALAAELGLDAGNNFVLATIHPETNGNNPFAPLDAILKALDAAPRPTVITAPNADPGGAEMRARIIEFTAARPWALFRDTLGACLYANAMRFAAVMLGNSSSGIIEAELFGLPVINVGARQQGRACGANVHHSIADADAICNLLTQAARQAPTEPHMARNSLYGDGHAAPRIATAIKNLPARDKLLMKKYSDQTAEFLPPWAENAAA